jgi:hypothetical protein
VIDFELPEPAEGDQAELFLTSFGEMQCQEAIEATTALANRSFAHALVRTAPTAADDKSDPFAYTTTSRYTSDRFYGVMIDTGASKRSTAGWGQYLAYQKVQNTPINTATAGAINVQFGIGSTSSVGSITVDTPVGAIEFHLVKADTPFLLCLADMDTLQVYYNNIQDKLITPSKSIPICRQFGHPFLLWGKTLQSFITSSFDQNPCYLTTTELNRLHRRFGHPLVERLHAILERYDHNTNKEAIKNLTKFCSYYQKYNKFPGRFKFVLRDDQDSDFNHSIFLDVMYIDGNLILYIVDKAT